MSLTAFDQFAVRAFEAEALDYLVKPVSAARFAATMTRVIKRLRAKMAGQKASLRIVKLSDRAR
jgi:two-component system LytT family response regulator